MNKQYPEIFRYERVKPTDKHYCCISPSRLGELFTNPGEWYKTEVLGQPSEFQGNTATVTGTICHHIYELAAKGKEYDPEDIEKQLIEYHSMRPELALDLPQILEDYPKTAEAVLEKYLDMKNPNALIEHKVISEVSDGIFIGGRIDRIEDNMIVDFKTVSKKPNEKAIPLKYKLQLMAYVAACNNMGMNIDKIRVVYGVKPTKKLPARCFVVTEEITDDHVKLIEYTINLITCSLEKCRFDPSLVPLIFKDFKMEEMY